VTDVGLQLDQQAGTEVGVSSASVGDYIALLKPRVMSLVVFTSIVGLVLAPGGLHPALAVVAILAIAVGAGASGALNMWYDADIDAVMSRTANRPVPAGRVTPGEALGFGLALSLFSVMTLGLATNWFAGAFLAFTIFFYAVIYTMWLKRWTPQNIVIGGAAGAFPPMVGWAAVTGGVSLESFLLFAMIFVWTPPHFWALALVKSEDYRRAGVPMLPNVAGPAATRRQIVLYSVILAPLGVAPALTGMASPVYGVIAAAAGLAFLWLAWRLLRRSEGKPATKAAWQLFGYSIFYLFGLYAALLADHVIRHLPGAA